MDFTSSVPDRVFLFIIGEQNFDAICLSTYRTACKLRYIQKRCNCKSTLVTFSMATLVREWHDNLNFSLVLLFWGSYRNFFVQICQEFTDFLIPVHLIDIYNVIEAVRDAGLNAVELHAGISVIRLENLVSSLFNQLSKRLPTTHTINPRESTVLLVEFLLATVDRSVQSKLSILKKGNCVFC